jgi:hypothetical protein
MQKASRRGEHWIAYVTNYKLKLTDIFLKK